MSQNTDHNESPLIQPRYGAVADLAIYSGLSPKTIRNLIDAGKLKSHKIGRRVLIAFEDFDQFMESNARRGQERRDAAAVDQDGRMAG